MAIIGSKGTWAMDNSASRAKRGPLVRVKHPDGHTVKMYEADAVAAGLLPGRAKMAPTPQNKLITPEADKAASVPTTPAPASSDSFTHINGIGPASERLLHSLGVSTLQQLREVSLDGVDISPKLKTVIEEWREQEYPE